jgi:hypothetical protein
VTNWWKILSWFGLTAFAAGSACGGSNTTSSGTGGTGGSGAGATTGSHGPGAGGSSNGGMGPGGSGGGGGLPACQMEAWATFGHDAARTFAANACVHAPFTVAWHYAPTPPSGESIGGVFNAIATKDAAYLKWKGHEGPYFGTPFVDAVTAAGANAWQFDSGVDSSFGQPLSIFGDTVVTVDDGMSYLSIADGSVVHFSGVDWWGQSAPTSSLLYIVNNVKVDGPGVFVGAYDAAQTQGWVQNQMTGSGQFAVTDSVGSIAVDQNTVYLAANYSRSDMTPPMYPSGVYAFNAASGTVKWSVQTTPASNVSAGGGRIYLAEGAAGATALVARNQSDGSVAWMASPTGLEFQAPVLAAGLVIVGTSQAVIAFDAATGKQKWSAPIAVSSFNFQTPGSTNLAAALASNTLVVASGTNLAIVDLANGKVLSDDPIPGENGATAAEPVLVGSRVYLVDGGGLLALDATP